MFPPAEVSSSPVHGCGEVLGPAGRGQQPVLEVSLVERHPGADVCGRSSLLLCISVPVGQRKLTQFYTLTTFHSRSVLNPEPVFAKMFWGKPPTVDRCVVSPQPWAFHPHTGAFRALLLVSLPDLLLHLPCLGLDLSFSL